MESRVRIISQQRDKEKLTHTKSGLSYYSGDFQVVATFRAQCDRRIQNELPNASGWAEWFVGSIYQVSKAMRGCLFYRSNNDHRLANEITINRMCLVSRVFSPQAVQANQADRR
jgi:hypothetical protein